MKLVSFDWKQVETATKGCPIYLFTFLKRVDIIKRGSVIKWQHILSRKGLTADTYHSWLSPLPPIQWHRANRPTVGVLELYNVEDIFCSASDSSAEEFYDAPFLLLALSPLASCMVCVSVTSFFPRIKLPNEAPLWKIKAHFDLPHTESFPRQNPADA